MNSKQLTLDDYFALKNSFETLEVLHDDSHKELKLKSRDGKLYLYEFYEYVDYHNGDDKIYETFVEVSSRDDAIDLMSRVSIVRVPYFRVLPGFVLEEREK